MIIVLLDMTAVTKRVSKCRLLRQQNFQDQVHDKWTPSF